MANVSGNIAASGTLAVSTVDVVTLAKVGGGYGATRPSVTVVNRTGTSEIWVRASSNGTQPPDPVAAGVDCYLVPAAVGATCVIPLYPGVGGGSVYVKLLSTGAMAYTVEAL